MQQYTRREKKNGLNLVPLNGYDFTSIYTNYSMRIKYNISPYHAFKHYFKENDIIQGK